MAYRKFQATQLFTGTRLLNDPVVLVADQQGTIQDIIPASEAGDDVQLLEGMLCPGFVNAHCHLELSHMLGLIPRHTGLVNFVKSVITQRHFDEALIREAIHNAAITMQSNGIVAVGDICNNTLTLQQKLEGGLHYQHFVEVSGWNPLIAQKRLDQSLQYLQAYQDVFPGHSSLVPHAPYSVSAALWESMTPYFEGQTITIHNQECQAENELFRQGSGDFLKLYDSMGIQNNSFSATGQNSLPSYLHYLQQAARLILVHNSFTTDTDLEYLMQFKGPEVFMCLCPNANLYIENILPPVNLFRQFGIPLVLGTDSLASNNQLSILSEIRLLLEAFPQIPLSELLQWATYNGARALNRDSRLGSFAPQTKPGILLLPVADHLLENQAEPQVLMPA